MDWVGHHCDIAHWGLGFDNSGPSEIEGKGEFPPRDAVWNTCTKYRIELKYPEDLAMTIAGGIMGALFHRERTGQGQYISLSLLRSALEGVAFSIRDTLDALLGQYRPPRLRLAGGGTLAAGWRQRAGPPSRCRRGTS